MPANWCSFWHQKITMEFTHDLFSNPCAVTHFVARLSSDFRPSSIWNLSLTKQFFCFKYLWFEKSRLLNHLVLCHAQQVIDQNNSLNKVEQGGKVCTFIKTRLRNRCIHCAHTVSYKSCLSTCRWQHQHAPRSFERFRAPGFALLMRSVIVISAHTKRLCKGHNVQRLNLFTELWGDGRTLPPIPTSGLEQVTQKW